MLSIFSRCALQTSALAFVCIWQIFCADFDEQSQCLGDGTGRMIQLIRCHLRRAAPCFLCILHWRKKHRGI